MDAARRMTPTTSRRFPPPWSVEEYAESFIDRDANGQALAYVYFDEEQRPVGDSDHADMGIARFFLAVLVVEHGGSFMRDAHHTVSIAGLLSALPIWLPTTTVKTSPLLAALTAEVWYVDCVAPAIATPFSFH